MLKMENSTTIATPIITEPPEVDCQAFEGEPWKCDTIIRAKRAAGCLSVIGCLFTIFLIVFFKKYKETSQRLIINLSVAAALLASGTLIDDFVYKEVNTLCKVQGALLTFFVWNCCLWIMTNVLSLYFKLVFHRNMYKYEKCLTAFCWAFPVVPMLAPFISDMYGPAGVWCWIKNDWRWRLADWYFLRVSSLVVFIYVMIHMTTVMYRMRDTTAASTRAQNTLNKDIKTLRVYPIVYFLVNLFPIVNRIQNAISGNEQTGYVFTLLLLQAMMDPSFGAIIAVVYVLDSRTRKKLTIKHFREAAHKWKQAAPRIQEYSLSGTNGTAA